MRKIIFDLQRFAEVLHGGADANQISIAADKTQTYGLAGNDTIISDGKSDVLLVGGSGDDVLNMAGGNGTLSGGKGSDTFNLSYSTAQKISAVIEDIDPDSDKIVIIYDGTAPQLNSVISGDDVIWTDDDGYFNLTLKGSNDAGDYYDDEGNDYLWEVLKLTNAEREAENLSPLTMSQALSDGAAIRSEEIAETFSHTRPDGTSCFTAVNKSYNSMGENIASGQTSPEEVVEAWMNSTGHRANILNENFKKLGVGYTYDDIAEYKHNWAQMFGGDLLSPDTISTADILKTTIEIDGGADYQTLTIDNSVKSPVTLGAAVKIADASTRTKKIKITGNALDNSMVGGRGNDSLNGAAGNNTLNGGKGNDTLVGGDGADVFIYENKSGKDVISNYGAGDIVSLDSGATIKEYYMQSKNAVIKFSSGSVTVKKISDAEITFAQDGAETIFSNGVFINGDSLVGGKGKDKIYGDAGDNVIIGGKGNDSLWGGDGADTFIYAKGDGKDIIFGFGDDDTLTFGNLDLREGKLNAKGTEIYLKIDSTSRAVTLKEFTATNFNINGSTYAINGNKLVKQ